MIETQEQFEKLRANLKAGVYADRPEVQAGLLKQAQEFKANHPQPSPEPQTAAQKNPAEFDPLSPEFQGGPFSDLLRGGGLAFRTLLEGPTKPITAGADFLTGATNALLSTPDRVGPSGQGAAEASLALAGLPGTPDVPPHPLGVPSSTQRTTKGFDRFLPKPTPLEGAIGDALVASTGGVGVAQQVAKIAQPGALKNIATLFAESPGIQGISASSAGGATELAREAGLGPTGQLGVGLAAGVANPLLPVLVGRTALNVAKSAGGLANSFREAGQRNAAANFLREQATDPTTAVRNLGRETLTAQPTGPTSRDIGLLNLGARASARDTTGRFGQQLSAANLERQRILDVIGGEDIAIAKVARDASTGKTRRAAFDAADELGFIGAEFDTAPVLKTIDNLLLSPKGSRQLVKSALRPIRKQIANTDSPQALYEVRKDINLAIAGKLEGKRDLKFVASELIQLKSSVDDAIETVAPGFKKYLRDYAELSADITARESVQDLQRKAVFAASDISSGREILSQAKFRSGLNRIKDTLPEEMRDALQLIADDLDIGAATTSAIIRKSGSDTFANISSAHVIGRLLGSQAKGAGPRTVLERPLDWLLKIPNQQVEDLIFDAMLNPQTAKLLMQPATPGRIKQLGLSLAEAFRVDSLLPDLRRSGLIGAIKGTIPNIDQDPGPDQGGLLDSPIPPLPEGLLGNF
ncbi:MAG: hypothetical protein IH859_04250 [Chloroflexi bacterium]|nr:hypothetical protein [Chloroflexota bacterium]